MIKPSRRGEMVRFNPEVSIRLIEFGRATARQPMWPRSWNRRAGPVAVPNCPIATRSPSAFPDCFRSQITANAVIARVFLVLKP
jgi:hypothetical protein